MKLKKFLLNEESKKHLATFLGEESQKYFLAKEKCFSISYDNITVGNMGFSAKNNHEEADTMIIYHAIQVSSLYQKTIVHCADTDVFVGLLAYSGSLGQCYMQTVSELYDIDAISKDIGSNKSKGVIALHVLTGCDITGKFRGKSKLPWVNGYLDSNEITLRYFENFATIEDPLIDIDVFEQFVCKIFCPGACVTDLATARWMAWTQTKNVDPLPPTKGALKEHVKRGWYAAKVFGQSHVLIQNLPAINTAGWITNDDGTFEPTT